jgi:hypothetical protein
LICGSTTGDVSLWDITLHIKSSVQAISLLLNLSQEESLDDFSLSFEPMLVLNAHQLGITSIHFFSLWIEN